MTFLQILWFVLICVVMTVYFVLDGFDLGIGVMYPFLGKSEEDKAILRTSIGPVWDANEVWLLTAGGALFAAFPPAYATTFSGFYLAIMLVLFGLIVRAVAVEFRGKAEHKYAGLLDGLFVVGSFLPALLFGVAVGNVLVGIPMNVNGDYTGTFFQLLGLFPLVCGLLGLAQFILQGCSWAAVKTTGDLHDRAVAYRKGASIAVIVLFVLASILFLGFENVPMSQDTSVLRLLFVAIVALGVICSLIFGARGDKGDLPSFLSSSAICLGLTGLTFASLFPNIVNGKPFADSLTIAASASSDTALFAMTIITLIGITLTIIYQVIIYKTFAGKITAKEAVDY